jgi:hypothetical protein
LDYAAQVEISSRKQRKTAWHNGLIRGFRGTREERLAVDKDQLAFMLIASLPSRGFIDGVCGKRAIEGGRRQLRLVMFQVDFVASHHNPILKTFTDRLRTTGKPHKTAIKTVAHMLFTIVNALCKLA